MNSTEAIKADAAAVKTLYADIQHAGGRLKAAVSEVDYQRHVKEILKGRKLKETPAAEYPVVLTAFRLALATHLATIGPIHPLIPETKRPATPNGVKDASQDPSVIRVWCAQYQNCNWGLTANVVDVDSAVKPGNTKAGIETWNTIVVENGEPDTYQVRTPSGGEHFYITEELPNGANTLGEGIDSRSVGKGYVVAAGSHVVKSERERVAVTGFYTAINNKPISSVPWVTTLKGYKGASPERGNVDEKAEPQITNEQLAECLAALDVTQFRDQSKWERLAMSCHSATAGEGYDVFNNWSLSDTGYNGRTDDMEKRWDSFKVHTGGDIAIHSEGGLYDCLRKAGRADLELKNDGFAEPIDAANDNEEEAVAPQPKIKLTATPFVRKDPKSVPPRQWLFLRHYIRKFCVADISPGGGGKSTNVIAESLAMATRTDLFNFGWMYPRPLKVWYWNGEDPQEEIDRRFAAAIKYYSEPGEDWEGVPPLDAKALELLDSGKYLFTDNGRTTPIKIATEVGKNGMTMAYPLVDALIDEARAREIDVLMIDPFVASHGISENDNTKIDRVIKEGWNVVCERADLCTDLIHHTRKVAKGVDYTAADARGASAIVDAARDVRVYNTMSAETAAKLHIPEADRWRYIRIDSDKPNMARRSGGFSPWRYLASVSLDNARDGMQADDMGVAAPWSPPEADPIATETRNEKIIEAALTLFKEGKRITKMHGNNAIKKVVPQFQRLTEIEDLNAADIKAAFDSVEDRTWKYRDSLPGQRSGTAGYYPVEK